MLSSVSSLFLSLFLGVLSAALTFLFSATVEKFYLLRTQISLISVIGLIFVFLIFQLVLKKARSFPKKITELQEYKETKYTVIWNSWMPFYHYVGALMSHFVGASVGRESVIVMTLSGFVEFFRLNLQKWIPIAASIGFGVVVGSPLAAVVFAVELFTTHILQKVFIYLGSWCGVLLLEHYHYKHLLSKISELYLSQFQETSFFTRLFFIFLLIIFTSQLSKIYLKLLEFFRSINKNRIFFSFVILIGISLFYYLVKEAYYLKSLSSPFFDFLKLQIKLISEVDRQQIFPFYSSIDLIEIQKNFIFILVFFIVLKLLLTAIFVGLGFYGGEFVPLVIIGSCLGVFLAQVTGENLIFGFAMGACLLFSGVSKLKWTSFILMMSLTQWNYILWGVILINFVDQFSGLNGTYKNRSQFEGMKSFKSFQFSSF